MQRINNFSHWVQLSEGERIDFASGKARIIKLDVNAPSEVCLHIINDKEESFFLALVKGRDTIEFHSEGSFALAVTGGDINLYTVDGDDPSIKVLAPVIFTKIAERRSRNPELERMVSVMEKNLNRRLEQQSHELVRLLHHRERARELASADRVPTTVESEPSPDGDAGPSDTPATPTAAGDGNNG